MDVAITDRFHRSHLHARSKTYVSAATDRLAAVTPGKRGAAMRQSKPIGERRIRLERSDPKRVRHASFIATNPLKSGKPHGRQENIGRRTGSHCRKTCVRGPADAMKRRSGIVRRPAAPDSASAASERCRGHETSREASDQGCRGVYVRHGSASVTEPRQVGPVVRITSGSCS